MAGLFGKVLKKVFGNKHEKDVKALMPIVAEINIEYNKLSSLSNDELRNKTTEFKSIIKEYIKDTEKEISELTEKAEETKDVDAKEEIYNEIDTLIEKKDEKIEEVLKQLLPQAFAVVKETAKRFTENETIEVNATELDKDLAVNGDFVEINEEKATYKNSWTAAGVEVEWNMIHYDVQLVGGIVLHEGKIAEMMTGEGKTLVSTLPAYLNALPGLGVHIVTVNDYLARRDSEWNAPIFNFLGITVDCIDKHQPNSDSRRKAYKSDLIYGTNNEFGFDYLRDNMATSLDDLVQQKLHYVMIDEVDSVLIDDARTPLIISGAVEKSDEKQFYDLKPRIQKLVDEQKKIAQKNLIEAKKYIKEGKTGYRQGEGGFALLRAYRAFPKNKPLIKFLSEPGMKQILLKTENYYMQDNNREMPLIDEELLFIIEEKQNSVELKDEGVDMITAGGEDKEFFIIPDVGGEIVEIDKRDIPEEEKVKIKDELLQNFAIKTERLHSINQLLKAYALFEKEVEYVVIDSKVKIVDENTGRVMDGRRYSDGLHQAIEAKENVKVEAASQTLATVTLQNFFRMYHKLSGMTGTAETEAQEFWDIYKLDVVVIPTNRPLARQDEEDLIYKTTREKFNAIAVEIERLTKQGRPVLVGTSSIDISELISKMLNMKGVKHNVLNAKQHAREADIVAEAGKAGAVTIATNMAGRGTDIKLKPEVIQAGGLAIIGSERHDSRRIDRQLRGRAGRQGDPGSSQFFISLEDRLMRLFGSERISKWMDRLGFKEGEVIQHSMISKNVETAQRKVEENNFGVRKNLLEYDDIMNTQREVIYKKRKNALYGERLSVDIMNTIYDLSEELVALNKQTGEHADFKTDVIRFFAIDTKINENEFKSSQINVLTEKLFSEVEDMYKRKVGNLSESTLPIFKKMFADRGATIKNVVVPFSDSVKTVNVIVPLEKNIEKEGTLTMTEFEKTVSLAIIDENWKDNLRQMDSLKQEVRNASIEQKDPLLVYKLEAFNLFKDMISEINREVSSFLFKGKIVIEKPEDIQINQVKSTIPVKKLELGRGDDMSGGNQAEENKEKKLAPVRVAPKVGRNEACPCGSGKKYKQCHGKQ